LHRLLDVAKKKTRVVVGLMSGTSHDGVDAAVARITGFGGRAKVEFVSHTHRPYPARLLRFVRESFDGSAAGICGLNFELGEFFGVSAVRAVEKAGLRLQDVDVVGSHGQTVHHRPPSGRVGGCTLQLGEGAVIARITGALTVTDFRTADMAAGGHGAPLVPYADWVLFRCPGEVTALQNIGGIANVTVLTDEISGVFGFDTGPGNSLMDEAVRIITGGKKSFDNGGKMARSGVLDKQLLNKLLSMPYFRKTPPKSTGRETFGAALAGRLFAEGPGVSGNDMLCTLAHFTAMSIHRAYEKFVFPKVRPDRVVVTGGGSKNRFVMELLRGMFGEVPVYGPEAVGVPAEAREPLCFAVLANETVCGVPSNLPGVTGARFPAVLGKISM
jgi:anhydro-N-acetylmuramic acid kinase